jgi:hypothetical protein
MENEKLDTWAVVALFGHTKIAGKVTTVVLGSAVMIRVDVPETKSVPSFYKLFNTSAIYDITPTDEETATFIAADMATTPLPDVYTLKRAADKMADFRIEQARQRALDIPEEFRDLE